MIRTFYNTGSLSRNDSLLVFVAGMLALLGLLFFAPQIARAEPGGPNGSDPVQLHCQSKLSSKVRSACQDANLIKSIRDAAATSCKNVKEAGNKKAECIEKKAKEIINKAAAKKPKSAAAFKKEVEKLTKKAGTDAEADCKNDGLCADCDAGGKGCIECKNGSCKDPAANAGTSCNDHACDLVKKYVNPLINLLSVSFGLIAVISLIYGGIMYSASQGDPQKVSSAKNRIQMTIIAIVGYFFLYGFLQFLIPGGIFR